MPNVKMENQQKINPHLMKKMAICAVICALILGILFGSLAGINAYRNSGKAIRKVVVLESENFTLTLPMYAYYYRSMESGADPDLVAMALAEQMALYEAALKDGESLSKDRKDALEQQMQAFLDSAKKMDISIDEYLSINYGRGIKMSDIRSLLEMTALAAQKNEALWASLAFSDEEIKEYCKDNQDAFLYSDYLFYVFDVPLSADMSREEKEQLVAQYEAYANRLAQSESKDAFLDAVIDYEEQFAREREKDESITFSEDEIAAIWKSVVIERSPYSEYTESSELLKDINEWLYDGARKEGETKVTPYQNLAKNVATIGVYYMTRPLYTNDDPTHNLYDIQLLFSKYTESAAKSGVEAAKAIYDKAPNKDTLKKLAVQYGGGLLENVSYVNTLDSDLYEWLGAERKEGDLLVYESSDGWHMVCYMEEGLPECYAQAQQILQTSAYKEQMEVYRKAHAVNVVPDSYKTLPETVYGWFIL